MNNIIQISLNEAFASNDVITKDPFTYKGASNIVIDLSDVTEEDSRVNNILIDWGDGSEREYYDRTVIFEYREDSIIDEVVSGFIGGSILGTFSHTFVATDKHINELTIQILITYESGVDVVIKQPLTIVQESYYDDIKEFNIANTAIHDDSLATIVNFQSRNNKYTWPAFLKTETSDPDSTLQDNPFDSFDCSISFGAATAVKELVSTGPFYPGAVVEYKVTVTSLQDYEISSLSLTDALAPIQATDPTSIDWINGQGVLPGNEEVVLYYTYTIQEGDVGSVDNTATINSPAFRSPVRSNTVTINVTTNLQVTKESVGSIISNAGEYIQYIVTATNPNAASISNVKLVDSLPGVENNVVAGDADLFTGTTLGAGETKTVEYEYQITTDDVISGSIVNTASLSGEGYPTVTASVTSTLTPLQQLQVTKEVTGGTLQVGEAVRYTVTATNPNPSTVNNVILTDSLPITVTDVVSGDSTLLTGTSLTASETKFVTYDYTIPLEYIGESDIINTATLSVDGIDPSSDSATATLQPLSSYIFTVNTTNLSAGVADNDGVWTTPVANTDVTTKPSDWESEYVGGESLDNQFKLPLIESGTYNFKVFWGDGTSDVITSYDDPNTLHTYEDAGVYDITITGQIEGWQFNGGGDRLKYTKTVEWTALTITTSAAFFGCEYYTGIDDAVGAPTITTTDLSNTFKRCIRLNEPMNGTSGVLGDVLWDVSGVTNFESMFNQCWRYDKPLYDWDISSATNTKQMFLECVSFNRWLDPWVVNNIITTEQMFAGCKVLNKQFSSWELASVTNMSGMFDGCASFNYPLGDWGPYLGNVTSTKHTFRGCIAFNQNLDTWGPYLSANTTLHGMFKSCHVFNNGDGPAVEVLPGIFNGLSAAPMNTWDTTKVERLTDCFYDCFNFNQNISAWELPNLQGNGINGMFRGAHVFNQNLDTLGPYLSACTNFNAAFQYAFNFNNGAPAGQSYLPMDTWDVSSFESGVYMFNNALSMNSPLSAWGPKLTNAITFQAMFGTAASFTQTLEEWGLYTGGVYDMRGMFTNAYSCEPKVANWDISGLNTAGGCTGMFKSTGGDLVYNPCLYDELLIGWSSFVQSNDGPYDITLDVTQWRTSRNSNESTTAKQTLVNDYGWTINDMEDLFSSCDTSSPPCLPAGELAKAGIETSNAFYNPATQGGQSYTDCP